MASNPKGSGDSESDFSFGVRELRQAASAQAASAPLPQAASAPKRGAESELPQAANENRGFDPYNTSGSFDHKKHWVRVGKR